MATSSTRSLHYQFESNVVDTLNSTLHVKYNNNYYDKAKLTKLI